jgi:hypothetical protein
MSTIDSRERDDHWWPCPADRALHQLSPLAWGSLVLLGFGHSRCGRRIVAALVPVRDDAKRCVACMALRLV